MPHSAYDIHLICGGTGAGKSTYSNRLAADVGGVRFSIDEWLATLHLPDQPVDTDFNWFVERVHRNTAQMRAMADQLVPLKIPAIFDCGFTNRAERDTFVNWAAQNAFTLQLHYLDVPTEVRWGRVEQRNAAQAETYQFQVTRFMFDFINSIWEPPTEAEMATLNGVLVTD